jgi:hypothetical protein
MHPLAARTCEPWPLAQARQIRPAAPVGAKGWGPADRSLSRQPERRRPIRRSGRDPVPTLRPTKPKPRKQGRSTYPHPPCRIRIRLVMYLEEDGGTQNVPIWEHELCGGPE